MSKRKRMLMIMYGMSVGGAELQFIELANHLSSTYQVRLVSLGGDGALKSEQVDSRIEIRVYSYDGYLNTALVLIKAFFDNVLYSARSVVTTSFIGDLLGCAICIFHKRRLISLQTVSKCMRNPIVNRLVLRKFDVLIAGALDIKQYLIASGQEANRIHVVHNWVDFSKRKPSEFVQETRRKLGIRDDQLIIGCIGRLHYQKGQIFLIRAFAKILLLYPNTMLLLVGEGETRKELEHEVSHLGLNRKVIFTGTATRDKYNNFLAAIDVYVQPSVFEGLPRTLLDAMFMGKAVVATDINGNREAIENDVNGLLVPSEDADRLCSAILRILRNAKVKSKLSTSASETARSRFSMEQQMVKLEQIISGDCK